MIIVLPLPHPSYWHLPVPQPKGTDCNRVRERVGFWTLSPRHPKKSIHSWSQPSTAEGETIEPVCVCVCVHTMFKLFYSVRYVCTVYIMYSERERERENHPSHSKSITVIPFIHHDQLAFIPKCRVGNNPECSVQNLGLGLMQA